MKLVRDERGAVMITGLFMAFLLASATWFLFGTMKAMVFRERVQETADAAAFSSAVIHAKGMNLIAAINLVFFAVTAVWLTLRIFEHGMYLVQSTVVWNASNCEGRLCRLKACEVSPLSAALTVSGAGGPAAACQIATGLQEVRKVNKEARQSIGDGMFTSFPHLATVQDATARLAPAAGAAASLAIGDRFGHLTIALSPSMVPVDDLVKLTGKNASFTRAFGAAPSVVDRPLGLPVFTKKFSSLCNRAATLTLRKVKGAFTLVPALGPILDQPLVKQIVEKLVMLGAAKVETEFCGDGDAAGHGSNTKLFAMKGPKGIFPHAENGNDLMQVWAFTRGEHSDLDDRRVAISAGRGKGFGEPTPGQGQWYLAQAEMFFDCDGGWGDAQCNGDDNAAFSMRWRARLHRVRRPDFAGELKRYLRDALFSGPVKDALKKRLGLAAPERKPGEPPPSLGEKADQLIVDSLFDMGWDWARIDVEQRTGIGNANNGGIDPEIVH